MPSYELPITKDGTPDLRRIRHDLQGSLESAETAFRSVIASPESQPACTELFEMSKLRLNEIVEKLLTQMGSKNER